MTTDEGDELFLPQAGINSNRFNSKTRNKLNFDLYLIKKKFRYVRFAKRWYTLRRLGKHLKSVAHSDRSVQNVPRRWPAFQGETSKHDRKEAEMTPVSTAWAWSVPEASTTKQPQPMRSLVSFVSNLFTMADAPSLPSYPVTFSSVPDSINQ